MELLHSNQSSTPKIEIFVKEKQRFVAALWENRERVGDLLCDLFENYERKVASNAPFLQSAESALDALGIQFTTHGRDYVDTATSADPIVIDLIFGIKQDSENREITVKLPRFRSEVQHLLV